MLLFMLLAASLAFTAGQYGAYETSPTVSEEPVFTNPETSATTQKTTTQQYNYPVVTGLRLKVKCFKELNATVAKQLLKQYLPEISSDLFRLTVKNITKL
ncbi:hypothetical protein AMEX_G10483 [Astyanax mexicanus]|uniref:Uncharacterized protein n=1 Tax=Astyanax mexicanus TaxID=7994 RepID=A0A8T2LPZ8_ASTMX|nr:hypothetical protein AMEX_G10483 [Astyanax mexicanus]